ncbi:MAG: prepilin-type N-terminal cleavage/methylation domain-containing protein [Thermodesulfovibrionales bacterium]|nr:prepilin-type N-terminal cleavage/methylation domain-containing protein [Thermodesulfovibrionales bacterium]
MPKISIKGFTLLELIISITIFSIILLILFGAMRLGHRSIEKAEKKIEFLERLRATLNTIDSQLQSQIPLTYDEDGEKKLYFVGLKDSLQFATNFSIWRGHKGYVKVQYNVEEDLTGRKALYITENTISIDQPKRTLLLAGVQSISFYYFYKASIEDEEGYWVDEWTEDSSIPEKVAINIIDDTKKINMNFLIFLRNQPALSMRPLSHDATGIGRGFPKPGGSTKN